MNLNPLTKEIKDVQKHLLHLNGNLLCAVDIETTGLIAGTHDIWQICVLPLDSYFKPLKSITPFYIEMKPLRPENVDPDVMTRLKLAELLVRGLDPFIAADLLDKWFEKLNLPFKKNICPLAQNWIFDSLFLKEWLGQTNFNNIFNPWYRDLLPVSLYLNDCADRNVEQIPFPKSNLNHICGVLNTEQRPNHDSLQDCLATAEAWSKILKKLW